ncbi:unnamed protein product (macronuclear) [Paramecium tetraurelia]|uniref:Uncharacterized protein n=1 Tax=Paramecium tetraurelia TaxID=5888 RepID=A0BWI1_PARTE|nr:uncharacterized protein GSPATT00032750001 [Paramecium tetraurelia]CAK62898.1 unnamed protein product [Paramecium tetraurelia]|eukprot:XP_001430296.1 hypothetical protein (macronuclear) [Paramecium tetraurelia strain d4-2]
MNQQRSKEYPLRFKKDTQKIDLLKIGIVQNLEYLQEKKHNTIYSIESVNSFWEPAVLSHLARIELEKFIQNNITLYRYLENSRSYAQSEGIDNDLSNQQICSELLIYYCLYKMIESQLPKGSRPLRSHLLQNPMNKLLNIPISYRLKN